MPSPQVQQWLDDGSRLRDDLLAEVEKLDAQRVELDRLLGERQREMSVLARILDRADKPVEADPNAASSDDPFNPNFNSKAAGTHKNHQPREAWHA